MSCVVCIGFLLHGIAGSLVSVAYRSGISHHQVVFQLLCIGLLQELIQCFRTSEDGLVEAGIHKRIGISLEILFDGLEYVNSLVGRNQSGVQGNQLFGYLAVDFRIVVLVEELLSGFLQGSNSFVNVFLFLTFQCHSQRIRIGYLKEFGSQHQGFVNRLLVVHCIVTLCDNLLDAFVGFPVIVISDGISES